MITTAEAFKALSAIYPAAEVFSGASDDAPAIFIPADANAGRFYILTSPASNEVIDGAREWTLVLFDNQRSELWFLGTAGANAALPDIVRLVLDNIA